MSVKETAHSAYEKLVAVWRKLKNHLPKSKSIFRRYFMLFAIVFSVALIILGVSTFTLVRNYVEDEQTELLIENAASMADTISGSLTLSEMNDTYSVEKLLFCETLETVSNSIDADVFVCDVSGDVIMCKERADSYFTATNRLLDCDVHDDLVMSDYILAEVYQEGTFIDTATLNDETYYIVGEGIYSDGEIIGTVFALTDTSIQDVVGAYLRLFLISAIIALIFAYACTYVLTKRMTEPIKQMSEATKHFAVGDFSYRVEVDSDDEIADLGRAFNEMANSLEVTETTRRNFISNVSHELKTPMTSMSGFVDGILDGTIPREKEDYYLQIVSSETKRLNRLVVSMLNMSKIESGDVEMKPTNYNISDQIIHILLTFEQKIDEKNIEIRGLEDLEPTYIVADQDMIYQAIYNLFDNAVKFTNNGGYIAVSMADKNSSIEVSIENSGEGIKSDEISKIFERFYKVDKSRSIDSKGAGLGLYLVKLMVEMHSGKVWAESDSETVAKFTFMLPKQYTPVYSKKENKK